MLERRTKIFLRKPPRQEIGGNLAKKPPLFPEIIALAAGKLLPELFQYLFTAEIAVFEQEQLFAGEPRKHTLKHVAQRLQPFSEQHLLGNRLQIAQCADP